MTEEYAISMLRKEFVDAKKAGATRQIILTIDINQGSPMRGRIQRNEEIKAPPGPENFRREVRHG